MLVTIIVATVASISVFADWEGSSGCYKTDYELLINDAELTRILNVDRTSMLIATGTASHHKSRIYRVCVNAYAYCEDCDLFGNDQGYGWMGNPGFTTAVIYIDGHVCYVGGAEYKFYEDGVYLATRYMCWNYSDYLN